jgi:hypothetical protein
LAAIKLDAATYRWRRIKTERAAQIASKIGMRQFHDKAN